MSNPWTILACGAFAAGVLWGLAQLIPALAAALGILIEAAGAAGGIAVATATTGFATAGVTATWLPTAASAGIAAAGVGMTYLVLVKIVEKAKESPYEWLLPALGLLAVFFVDLTKDLILATTIERASYALATGLFTMGGGLLLMQRHIAIRAMGFVLPFMPFVVVCSRLTETQQRQALKDLVAGGGAGVVGLAGVFFLGLLIVILGVLLPGKK